MNNNLINVKNILGQPQEDTYNFSNLALVPKKSFLAQYHYIMKIVADTKLPLAHTKSVSEVKGTTRKPYKQKGTGNARRGTMVSAINRGGGIAHGPKAKKKHRTMNALSTKKAKKMAIGTHLDKNTLFVIRDFEFESHKTKNAINFIKNFNITPDKKCVIIDDNPQKNMYLSVQNIPNICLWKTNSITVHALFKADILFISQKALENLDHSLN